ncbi:3-dehydroshikimate dehydratase, partial [Aspergillus ellipticus CBS 707.79]
PVSFATYSIGTPTTPLPTKLSALSAAGFSGIELSFPDILQYGSTLYNRPISPTNYPELVQITTKIHELCDARNLTVMMLQPFANFEGWPRGSPEREDAFRRAEGWSEIMTAVGTSPPQSNPWPCEEHRWSAQQTPPSPPPLPRCKSKFNPPRNHHHRPKRLAYENWCWSSHAPRWSDIYALVHAVNRPNIGLCLDTFQTAGSEFADPTTSSGLIESEGVSLQEVKDRFAASMETLRTTVPAEKIYLLQVSDAYRPIPRLTKGVVDGMEPRARWSHAYRPVPYAGGYLPVEEVGRAVLGTGFRGWFSGEVFD